MAKQRGRPKSEQTIARETTETWLRNPPSHIKPMTKKKRNEVHKFLDELEHQRKIILSQHSRTIPDELIYSYESVGHRELFEETPELLAGEALVIKKYNSLVEATKQGQKDGAAITAKKAHTRAKAFWDNNPNLFEAMGRPRNANTTAQRIIDNWPNRGDGGKVPSINTIKNWYQLIQNSKDLSSKK